MNLRAIEHSLGSKSKKCDPEECLVEVTHAGKYYGGLQDWNVLKLPVWMSTMSNIAVEYNIKYNVIDAFIHSHNKKTILVLMGPEINGFSLISEDGIKVIQGELPNRKDYTVYD